MKSFHGLLAGALVLVAAAGCSEDSKIVKDKGTYAPIITGLKNTTGEPSVRGVPNDLEVLITNVNGLPLVIHWSATGGVLSDSTGPTAVWTPPDSVGLDSITVSVEATDVDADVTYFKTTTFPMYVDNLYERWTDDIAIKFDVAPTPSGGLLFAQLRNNVTGEGDVYRVTSPLGLSEKLTADFFSVSSPTARGDEQQVVFAGRRRTTDSTSIWAVPWAGGDTLSGTRLVASNINQRYLGHPRFAWSGAYLLYASDSALVGLPKLWYRDVSNISAPVRFMSNATSGNSIVRNSYLPANWGPGGSSTSPPESVIARSVSEFNQFGQKARGTYKFKTLLFTDAPPTTDQAWIADTTIAEPDWSSNGTHIVFSRREPGKTERDIWIIATNATSFAQAKQVTRGPADDSHPRFSRDGSTIFFVSNRQDRYGLNGLFGTERRGTNLWSVRRFDIP